MRERMESFVVSQSSVSVAEEAQPTNTTSQPHEPNPSSTNDGGDECGPTLKMKNTTGFFAIERLQKLIRGFKNISHLFYKVDDNDDDETEMEIGLPTDVDHVAHIGWDTPNVRSLINGWDSSIGTFPFGQFELKQGTDSSISDLHELV